MTHQVLTGADGTFSVSGLALATYRLEVVSSGFKRATQENIQLTTTGSGPLTVILEPGSTSDVVAISANTPAVQSSNAEMEAVYGTRQIRELPVIDRNHQQFAGLQSGITPPQPALDMVRDPDRNRFFSTNGQAPTNNEYRLDGVTGLEPFRGSAIRVQPVESVQELRVETSNLPADRGFAAGAQVTNISHSGTNELHGDLFEFHSGNILRTRNFFNRAGNPDPRFVHNQFGAALGGPIVKDHTFFFGSYEGNYDGGSNTQITTVPTTQALGGNFSGIPGLTLFNPNSGLNGVGRTAFNGDIIPAAQINSAAAAIAAFFPAPNRPGLINNLVSNVPFRNHDNRVDGRIDQHFSDRTSAFLRYGFSNDWAFQASPLGNIIGSGTRDRLLSHNVVAGLTQEFGPRLTSELRFGYNRYDQRLRLWGDQSAVASRLGLSNFNNNLIGINIAGFGSLGAPPYIPEHGIDNTFNGAWSWSLRTSMHNIIFGADVRRFRTDGFTDTMFGSLFGPNGTAYFGPGATMSPTGPALTQFGLLYNSLASFLLGAPSQIGTSTYFVNPSIRQTQYSAWVGDTIQIMRRVMVNIGVRYQIYSPLEGPRSGDAQFFNPANNTVSFAGIGGTFNRVGHYDLDNIAPRVGIAVRLTDRTVVRGGYGIEFFQPPYMFSGFMAPTYGVVSGVQGGFTTAPMTGRFGAVFPNPPAAPVSLQNGASAGNLPVTVLQRHADTPYVQKFNLQVQQDFYGGTVLALGYAGALDRHLPYIQELNAAMPGTGVAGLPFFGLGRTGSTLSYNSGLTSNYNSLQISLNRRFAQGLSFTAAYTLSKALGYTGENGLLLNPFQLRSNYGPLDFDRQHVLSISHVWEIPFGRHGSNMIATLLGGWQVNGIFSWDSGTPLTITADPIACACPGNTVLANVTGSPYLSSGLTFLNPAAFTTPTPGQFANTGRGALRARGYRNYDFSLFKNFHVRDRFNLQLRGEAYNLTNSPHFASPVTNINSPDFGQVVSTVNGSFGRQVNLALRVGF